MVIHNFKLVELNGRKLEEEAKEFNLYTQYRQLEDETYEVDIYDFQSEDEIGSYQRMRNLIENHDATEDIPEKPEGLQARIEELETVIDILLGGEHGSD